jgi:hypothetical protein
MLQYTTGMDFDPKEQGDDHYSNKFINRGKTHDRNPGRHTGNSLGVTCSRPRGHGIWENWRFEKALNRDVEQKLIVDYKKLDVSYQYKKNTLPSSVALIEKPKMNEQKAPIVRKASVFKEIKKKSIIIKLINFPDIHKNLYIANANVFCDLDKIKDMCTIINFSKNYKHMKTQDAWSFSNLCHYIDDKKILYKQLINIKYDDSHMNFKEIKEILDSVMTIINNNINYPVLIVCDKGVNRATSAAVAYAMTEKGFTFDAAIDYIDTVKLSNYANWDSLTNTSIRNALKLLPVRNNSIQ